MAQQDSGSIDPAELGHQGSSVGMLLLFATNLSVLGEYSICKDVLPPSLRNPHLRDDLSPFEKCRWSLEYARTR